MASAFFIRNIGAYSKILHLNKNINFNPVCIIKSYLVHTMLGRFLSFKRPNLTSETEETSYFGCKELKNLAQHSACTL